MESTDNHYLTHDATEADVQGINNSSDEDDERAVITPPSAKRSKPATPLQAATHLLEISSRINNVVFELQKMTAILSDDNKASDALSSLEKSITPFLTLASQGIIDSAQLLSPNQQAVDIHNQQDIKWKQRVLDDSKEKDTRRPQLQFIDAYVTSCYLNDEEFWRKKNLKKTLILKRTADAPNLAVASVEVVEALNQPNQLTTHARVIALQNIIPHKLSPQDAKSIILPLPQNGSEYTKLEVIAILERCTSRQKSKAIKEMISKEYIPCRKSKIYDILKLYTDCIEKGQLHGGMLNYDWGKQGKPLLNTEKMVHKKRVNYKHPRPTTSTGTLSEPVCLSFPPRNGSQYTKAEFISLIADVKGKSRSNIIKYIIQNKLVPVKKTTLYLTLQNYEKNPDLLVTNEEWTRGW